MFHSFIKGPVHLTICSGKTLIPGYADHRKNWNNWLNSNQKFYAILRVMNNAALIEPKSVSEERINWIYENRLRLSKVLLGIILVAPRHIVYDGLLNQVELENVDVHRYASMDEAIAYLSQKNLRVNGSCFNLHSLPELFCDLDWGES